MQGVGYDRFLRTSETEHRLSVTRLWNVLLAAGHVHKGTHSGWYCVADECFVPEGSTKLIGSSHGDTSVKVRVSAESGRPVEWTCEENYIFDIASQREALLEWLGQQSLDVRLVQSFCPNTALDFDRLGRYMATAENRY
jgi:methionyl-tRNA synthetase